MTLTTYKHPERSEWQALLQRPVFENNALETLVGDILSEVKRDGDEAIRRFARKYDGVKLAGLEVSQAEIYEAVQTLPVELKEAIRQASENITKFHAAQLVQEQPVETMPGVLCWRKSVAIDKVGLYIPGGTAPLFSTILMLGLPARIAGCKEIVLCSPPNKEGKLHPAILYAAHHVGIARIFKVGGAQAVAAMAYGTESVPAVYKIFGPGNQYVTSAKQLVQKSGVAIDMPAGPSEVAVLADETANPAFVAADLLSQAEHGADSQVLLVTTSEQLGRDTEAALQQQLELLSRNELASKALANSKVIVVKTLGEGIDLINEYAPEHLIISCADEQYASAAIVNAGSVFLGNYSPESVGDYASGTNHTLPTNGYAKAYSGVSVDSFVKKITYQKLTREGLNAISDTVQSMATAEGLDAHARAVSIRLEQPVTSK